MTGDKIKSGRDERRRGWGAYALVAVLLLALGILLTISLNNYRTYRLKEAGKALTLSKGKFALEGDKKVESFAPVVVEEADVSSLTSRRYNSKDAAYKAIFGHLMARIDAESAGGYKAGLSRTHQLLEQAQAILDRAAKDGINLANSVYRLAKKEVAIAEMSLERAYRKALPVYERALKQGMDEAGVLQAKMEAMQARLGLAPGKRTETAGKSRTTPRKSNRAM